MMYQVVESKDGGYVKDGVSYDLLSCNKATSLKGVNIGWQQCHSKEEAVQFFGLVLTNKIVEEEFLNGNDVDN